MVWNRLFAETKDTLNLMSFGKEVRDKTREMRTRNSYCKPFLKIPSQI